MAQRSRYWGATHPAYDVLFQNYHCLCGAVFDRADELVPHCVDKHRKDRIAKEVLSSSQYDTYVELCQEAAHA